MNWIKATLSLAGTLLLIILLNSKIGDAPPIGRFLDPFAGFWANAESAEVPAQQTLTIPGVREPVEVLFDEQLVPHVFARNNYDLYFTQGYLTAMHRLWQMEFQTHAAAGRISELVGDKALELDRYQRRMGTVYGAERTLETIMADSTSRMVVEAYTAGVNAYIAELSPREYPLEYKLLNYAPEPWTPLKCALLQKQMAHTLSSGSDDFRMTNILNKYGREVVADLFPSYPFRESPIIPAGTPWDFTPLSVPKPPAERLVQSTEIETPRRDPAIGSNNWAVSADKSATGYPILANDPHLTLTLPSIWYQIQLVSPDVNVCGASLPGSPFVISGFNEQIAWGVTNVGSDVLDWYEIKYRDSSRTEYRHGNQWKPVTLRIEEIRVRGKASRFDTVRYTHHGPVVYEEGSKAFRGNVPVGRAMRWIALEPSNEIQAFYQLNRAKNYDQYVSAIAHYASPAQNFVFADAHKDIAIWPNGRFPLKWKDQGKFILDGSNPEHDWQGWIPHAQNPHVRNPPRGFVSSANQFPADTTYPYYLDWHFEDFERAARINDRLTRMQRITADSLRALQNDNFNVLAQTVLPTMLSYLREIELSAQQREALQVIRNWSLFNDAGEIGPTIFTEWWNEFNSALWEDEFGSTPELPMRYPTRDRTVHLLLNEPGSPYIDNVITPEKETLANLLIESFQTSIGQLQKQHGELGPDWEWATHKSTDIRHIALIPAFSRMDVVTGGGRGIVNATTETTGPSWRMIVGLGPQLKAFGVYPGGQSGNPGSFYYDNLLETWRKGELHELVYLQSPDDANSRIISRWKIGN